MTTYLGEMRVQATVTIHNQEVLTRVTGPDGDEWRSQFYDLRTAEDVIQHFIFNAVTNRIHDISRLDGWADCDPSSVTIEIDDTDTWVETS